MHTLLSLIQGVDVRVYYWLSRFHGSWSLDRLASNLESNTLFKSGPFISLYWYFWFRGERDQSDRRNRILSILVGTLAGLFIARMVASLTPFRLRPMYDPSVQHHPFSIPISPSFIDWSSFPSDHAAYLAALGFGLILLSRRLAVPITLYLAAWICLPRLYLGIHYTSDIVVGAAIGITSVWAALQLQGVRSNITDPLLAYMAAKPQVFYTVAFLIMFEMATMFWDVRGPLHAVMHSAAGPHHKAIEIGMALLAGLCAGGFVLWRREVGVGWRISRNTP